MLKYPEKMLDLPLTEGSPNETRGVIDKYINNNGFVCIKVDKLKR